MSLSKLASGRRVTIVLVEQGCFHHCWTEFRITGGRPATVEIVERERCGVIGEPLRTGRLELSDADLVRLDGLLHSYRMGMHVASKSIDWVLVQWHDRSGYILADECYHEASGHVFDTEECLTLRTLMGRLDPGGPREARPPAGWVRVGPGRYAPSPECKRRAKEREEREDRRRHAGIVVELIEDDIEVRACVRGIVNESLEQAQPGDDECRELGYRLWRWARQELLDPYPPQTGSVGDRLLTAVLGGQFAREFLETHLRDLGQWGDALESMLGRQIDWDEAARLCLDDLGYCW